MHEETNYEELLNLKHWKLPILASERIPVLGILHNSKCVFIHCTVSCTSSDSAMTKMLIDSCDAVDLPEFTSDIFSKSRTQ